MECRDESQCSAVYSSSDEKGRPHLEHCAEAGEGTGEPEGDDEAEGCDDAGGDAAEEERVESGYSVERDNRKSKRPEGDGCRVGEQSETCGFERVEAEADEEGPADGDGGSEAGGTFKEGPEAKGDEHKLEAAVGRDAEEAVLQKRESARASNEVIHEEHGEDDPADRKESVGCAVAGGKQRHECGHPEYEKSDD